LKKGVPGKQLPISKQLPDQQQGPPPGMAAAWAAQERA